MTKIDDVKFENGFQYAALAAAGITTLEQCAEKGTAVMLKVRGIGKRTVRALRNACEQHSIEWKKCEYEVERIEEMAAFFEKHGAEKHLARRIATAGFHERKW